VIFWIILMLTGSEPAESSGETVYVHEWGVVQIDEAIPMAEGAESGIIDANGMLQPEFSLIVDAPVLWFHGPEFTGTLTVEVQNGYFSLLSPKPVMVSTSDESIPALIEEEISVAVWEGLKFTHENTFSVDRRSTDDLITGDGFLWAMPFWREVPSLTVGYETVSYTDRFIYYECSASNLLVEHDPLLNCESDAIVFYDEGGKLTADLVTVNGNRNTIETAMSTDRILSILAGWGDEEFLDEEIEALLQTWEPSLLRRCLLYGQRVIMFPLTEEQVESISTIDLQTDQGYNVEYSRLFLAMASVQ